MKSKVRNFQIQARLGSGSYGVIFKAINKTDKSQCVLKQIKMNKMSERAKKSTLNQATIMGKLIHPFIVNYKQSFVEDNTLNIVMQYCDNGDLSMYLKMQNKKPLKQQKIWKFFIQICMGLQHIHKSKILHRDIKTLNIFLNKNEDVKIGDLGVAKMLLSNDFAQTMVGTPFYLSPQLCEEKPYNQKSDIWALGCLLYELCTFRHPFEAANQASLILKIIRGKFSPIPQFYSKQLKDMVSICLERDYKRRPTASMILTRPKIKQYIKQFGLEEKVVRQYQKLKGNKENKQPQIFSDKIDSKKVQVFNKQQQNVKVVSSEKKRVQINTKLEDKAKKSEEKKYQIVNLAQKPSVPISVSGMPEKNIVLPDKQRINQRLQPKNQQVIEKKENKYQISTKLAGESGQNQKPKNNQIPSRPIVTQHKSRLEKIDHKIQQQIKKQKLQVNKSKQKQRINQRKKSQTPGLITPSGPRRQHYSDRKSVPNISKQVKSSFQIKKPENNNMPITNIPPLPPSSKNKDQVIKVKMEKPSIPPKVFESNQKPIGIKSRGFAQQIKQEKVQKSTQSQKNLNKNRNNSGKQSKPVLFGMDKEQQQRKSQVFQKRKMSTPFAGIKTPMHYQSQKNIKLQQQFKGEGSRVVGKKEPDRYVFKKKPQVSHHGYSRVRKGSSNDLSRNAKNVSKYNQVTKQQEDLVMNLPDSLGQPDSSSEQEESPRKVRGKQFKLKQIDNELVLQKYEEIMSSKSIEPQIQQNQKLQGQSQPQRDTTEQQKEQKDALRPVVINKNLNEYNQDDMKTANLPQKEADDADIRKLMEPSIHLHTSDSQRPQYNRLEEKESQKQFEVLQIQQNQSLKEKLSRQEMYNDNDEILDESQEVIDCESQKADQTKIEEQIYEVNHYTLNSQPKQNKRQSQQQEEQDFWYTQKLNEKQNRPYDSREEWSFDEEPQLPMLEDKQSPFFEEANPYLVAEEETVEDKKIYLQKKLEENMKRQDQINKLMQIKIQDCRNAVPKNFDEILEFFRRKINMDDQYTENDEREVEQFLRRKGLTDQRKFQNIYKIMHFEMQLENTRTIIQRICKKLAELDNDTQ